MYSQVLLYLCLNPSVHGTDEDTHNDRDLEQGGEEKLPWDEVPEGVVGLRT